MMDKEKVARDIVAKHYPEMKPSYKGRRLTIAQEAYASGQKTAYAPDRITPEVVEAAARAISLNTTMTEDNWPNFVGAAKAALLAAFATLGGV
jgi:hypothetical protein